MKLEIGTIIRTKHQINNYPKRDGERFVYNYYKLFKGEFTISDGYGCEYKFNGFHFRCQGSDYWHYNYGTIAGLELLDKEYEIVEELPNDLKH